MLPDQGPPDEPPKDLSGLHLPTAGAMSPAEAVEPLQQDVMTNAPAVNAFADQPAAASKWEQTTHGKGRVRPRKNQPSSAQTSVPRLTAVAHT